MEANDQTHKIFKDARCTQTSKGITTEFLGYINYTKDYMLFFFPSRNKLTMNKIVFMDIINNTPTVRNDINEKEWVITNNEELEQALKTI
jgi:hypothetical protein